MGKRIAILQSNYIPWKGYFDLIRSVDQFILYDEVQYTRSDWRNRNKIKTREGVKWLTIPVSISGKFGQLISDTLVSDPDWPRKHWEIIEFNYKSATYFPLYADELKKTFFACSDMHLSQTNRQILETICRLLKIHTQIQWSTEFPGGDGKTDRLVSICQQAGANEYLSGPAARNYIEPELFERAGISLKYADYSGYPEYPQLFGPFEHAVSIIDLLFNAGPDSLRYMKTL